MVFFSLQGLGNSILNFPVFRALAGSRPVKVVAFENGSASFYRAFHDDVVGVRSNRDLVRVAASLRDEETFACHPTWRRELTASLLTRARRRYRVRAGGVLGLAGGTIRATPGLHDLDQNRRLLERVPGAGTVASLGVTPAVMARTLGLHATASTESKYYPVEFWTDLLRALAPRFDAVDLYCGPAEHELRYLEGVVGRLGPDDAAKVTIQRALGFGELAARFAGLAHFIGHDSAPMHLAALLGRPTLALWSFADYRRIHPYGDQCRIYMPRETKDATDFAYPAERPAYLARARAADVVAIIEQSSTADFEIARPDGRAVLVKLY